MQSLSSKGQQIVISYGLKQPRGLALDPDGGHMFFSDWHESTSRIEEAWLDGSHRRVLVCFCFASKIWSSTACVSVIY